MELLLQQLQVTLLFDLLNNTPNIRYYYNLLTADECDYVINNIDNFQKSLGFDFETNQAKLTDWRTSSVYHDYNKKFNYIVKKASELSGYPISNIEILQVLKYERNEYYKPHWDYFNFPPTWVTTTNDRVATMIVYLNDNFTGGLTNFPELNINVIPKKGSALFFRYDYLEEIKKLTLHTGMPVIAGTKYIATVWIRSTVWIK